MGEAERLLALFERLPDSAKGEVLDFTEFLARKADPVAWAIENAPEEDERLTTAKVAEIEAGKADILAGRVVSFTQIESELGL